MTVLHIITGLNNGGAEAVLYRLISNDTENEHHVISLMDLGVYGNHLKDDGVSVYSLHMPRGKITIKGLKKLNRLVRSIDADVIQTMMYHADLIGGLCAWLAGSKPIIWGIHHSKIDSENVPRSTRFVARLCSIISRVVPSRIICCSDSSARTHSEVGYCKEKMITIPNGYSVEEFKPDVSLRRYLREQWEVQENEIVFGMVARWNSIKDHNNLITALGLLNKKGIDSWKCVFVGPGMDHKNNKLVELLRVHGVSKQTKILGPRTDIPAVMNAIDLHILSSRDEAFPNVLSEAMACGTPCLSTDVGDAASILGDTGWITEPSNSTELCKCIELAIEEFSDSEKWIHRKEECRNRIVEKFSLERMVNSYQKVWKEVLETR